MKRKLSAVCFALALLTLTTIFLPLKTNHFFAASTTLRTVVLRIDGTEKNYNTGARTVGEFLLEQEVILGPKDQIDKMLTERITESLVITVRRAVNVNVMIDGIGEKRRLTPGSTVENLINTLQIEYDISLLYDGDAAHVLTDGETLRFSSWYSRLQTYLKRIPYETEEIHTSAVRMGMTDVRQQGVVGETVITEAVIFIGGEERQREVINETVLLEPVMEIIDVGTGGALGTLADINDPSFQYVTKYTMTAYAYTAGIESTGKQPGDPGYGITRSGEPVRHGIVAVDPNVIPLGTKLYVEGYGYALAADTGGSIIGMTIDLYYESVEDARRFGRKTLNVYVLE